MISAEDEVNIVDSYYELGSYRAAARACGVDHHTWPGRWPVIGLGRPARHGVPLTYMCPLTDVQVAGKVAWQA